MRHFMKIAVGLPILQIAQAIQFDDRLWGDEPMDLWADGQPTELWDKFPQARPLIFDLMRIAEAVRLRRVSIERQAPGGQERMTAESHVMVYELWLNNHPGSGLTIGDETIQPEVGDGWVYRLAEGQTAERVNGSVDHSVSIQIELDTA